MVSDGTSTSLGDQLRELLVHINDPRQRLFLEQMIAEVDSRRRHDMQVSGDALVGAAIAGDSHGPVTIDQSTHTTQTQGGDYAEGYIDKRIINILLAGNDFESILATLAAIGINVDPQLLESPPRQQAAQLLAVLSDLSWSATLLRRAFSKVAPFHTLPDASEHSLLQSMLFQLANNTVSTVDPLERFARVLLTDPELTDAHRAVLSDWLGLPQPVPQFQDDPGLLIAIDRMPQSSELYQILAWRWPDRLKLWPPVGEDACSLPVSEIPQAIQRLYHGVFHHIARFGGNLRIELLLHHTLLVEPSHEWKVAIVFDEDDPDDVAEQPLYIGHPVVVRSVERALSPKPAMVHARALWRTRWDQLPDGSTRDWLRPQHAGAAQYPPFFCPLGAEDFAEDLFNQLTSDDYLCFVETVAPPAGIDFIKKVLLRVVRAGIPIGLWFAHNADRSAPIYQCLDGLLEPQRLPELPRLVRQHWKHLRLTRPLLFYDDPSRMPYDPDKAAFEAPSAESR